MARTKIAYIAGWGRSGSTLLDVVLGATPGFFSVGELFRIWEYGFQQDGACGCGERILSCPHWQAVFTRAFGGVEAVDVAAIRDWQNAAAKTRHIPRVRQRVRAQVAHPAPALQQIGRFYQAIAATTDSRVIVDSSKHPMYGALLSALPELDVTIIHLVRSPHALAYSWQRKKLMPDTGRYFRVRSAAETTRLWLSWNIGISYLARRLALPLVRVRYEDFVAGPRATLQAIYSKLDEPRDGVPVDEGGHFAMYEHHTIVGNPMKFQKGTIALRLDAEWERALSRRDRRIVDLLAWPLLLRYGYR